MLRGFWEIANLFHHSGFFSVCCCCFCGPDVEELVVACIRLEVIVADLLLYRHCCSSCGSVTEFQICISSVASGHIFVASVAIRHISNLFMLAQLPVTLFQIFCCLSCQRQCLVFLLFQLP